MTSTKRKNPPILILIVLLCIAGLTWFTTRGKVPGSVPQQQPAPSPTVLPAQVQTISMNGNEYAYSMFTNSDVSHLTLVPNYENRQTALEIIEREGCTSAINGGFYNTDYSPIGLVIVDGLTVSAYRQNRLFDGFIAIGGNSTSSIGLSLPENPRTALQTGPLLYLDGKPLTLSIRNDERARRMTAIQTDEGILLFVTLYDAESVYSGPLLAQVPDLIKEIAEKHSLSVQSAINLDGGSASYYSNGNISLSELTTVGSLFCYR